MSEPQFNHPDAVTRGWYWLCRSGEIRRGKVKALRLLGRDLAVYRGEDGRVHALDAYCAHMGAHLASHDGCIQDGVVVCPFHKWNFDGSSGDCVRIPYSDLPPSRVGLKMYPTREVDGMVLIWYHPEGTAPELEPYVSPLHAGAKWVLYDTKQWVTTCPFRDILENLFDTMR